MSDLVRECNFYRMLRNAGIKEKEQVPEHPTIVGRMVVILNRPSCIDGMSGKVIHERKDGMCTVNVNYEGYVIPWKVRRTNLEVVT